MRSLLAFCSLLLAITAPAAGQARALGPEVPTLTSPAAAPSEARNPLLTSTEDTSDALNPVRIMAQAGNALPGSSQGDGKSGLSTAINIMVVLTVISLAPSLMLMTTCFMRMLIVLGLLRQALGTSSVPPPQVITALSLFMTLLVMSPTLERINKEAIAPYRSGAISSYDDLWDRAKQPMRDFMFDQIDATGNWGGVYTVLDYRGVDISQPDKLTRADVDMVTLVPAYMMSELKVSFLLGFKVYLPFLVIDVVISTMLIAMSMIQLPPVLVSLPFKLLLFVLVDGWVLVVGGLMRGFVRHEPGAQLSWLFDTPLRHALVATGIHIG
ncbi:MAG: flagellar type III secretion system pore protein FliP [Phycisphaerales bacterium]|jgi:flagellar biosynthetic protein FliP